jgi:uncharacterized membrane protein YkvA (DUF1232 family)
LAKNKKLFEIGRNHCCLRSLPTDAIFDLTPLIGYSDDLGVLLFALTQVSTSITSEIKEKARNKLAEWFGEISDEDLQELENKIF